MSKQFNLSRGKTLPDTSGKSDFHDLVDNSTVTISDIRQDEIVSGSGLVVRASSAPSDTDVIWYDTVNLVPKAHDGSNWIVIPAVTTPVTGEFVTYDGTVYTTAAVTSKAPVGTFSNLSITRPTAATVDVDADSIVLADSSNVKYEATSVNLTLDITASGANGLDTGSEANVWYYIWVIYNGTTVAGLLSASSTLGTITLPSGYTYGALVGAVKNTSGDFVDFIQTGNQYWYSAWPSMGSGTVTIYTSLDITNYVPSALSNVAIVQIDATTNQNTVVSNLAAPGTDNTDIANILRVAGNGNNSLVSEINVITANTLYWGSSSGSIRCAGFKINKL